MRETRNSEFSPFRTKFGEQVGIGGNNIVRAAEPENRKPAVEAGKLVIKVSHRPKERLQIELKPKPAEPGTKTAHEVRKANKERVLSPVNEAVFQGTLYKKKKYEILKTFLGDFIPDSSFVVGHKKDGPVRPKEYTIQDRIPQYAIADLTPEQRRDPRLLRQMYVLLIKLQNMYRVLGQVDQIVHPSDPGEGLDAKLDLGGISDFAYDHLQDNPNSLNIAEVVEGFQKSKNLLVDPGTLQLFCVDFDEGKWSESKEAAKIVAEHIIAEDPHVQEIIAMSPMQLPERMAS